MRERSRIEWLPLVRGQLPRTVYSLWRRAATGVLTVAPDVGGSTLLVLRGGSLMVPASDALGRRATQTLEGLCSLREARYHFDGGVQAHPPSGHRFHLGRWVRRHYESQVDRGRALAMTRELAGVRLELRASSAPPVELCDDTDRRILVALAHPRRLEQIWTIARCPRFRLLSFVHFLRELGAIDMHGVAATARSPVDSSAAMERAKRLLGVTTGDDPTTLKRAYRRCVRALHPDLHTGADGGERKRLEQRLADVNGAYRLLTARGQ